MINFVAFLVVAVFWFMGVGVRLWGAWSWWVDFLIYLAVICTLGKAREGCTCDLGCSCVDDDE